MKERPILFNGEMVRAILDGRKTQTRRVIKPQPDYFGKEDGEDSWHWNGWRWQDKPGIPLKGPDEDCPYGQPGDRLYVRETWRCRGGKEYEYQQHQPSIMYHVDATPESVICDDWRPSIHMPKWASRILLEIESVRVERVQSISDFNAFQEGAKSLPSNITGPYCQSHVEGFRQLWNSINEPRSLGWDFNPWVWAITFRRVK